MLIRSSSARAHKPIRNKQDIKSSDAAHQDVYQPSEASALQLIPRSVQRTTSLLSILENHRQKHDLPSQAAAVLKGGSLEVEVTGTLYRGSSAPVEKDSKFHLGSNTKMMTAAMLARLVERGQLKWSTTVSEAFPKFASEIHPRLQDVTLEMLTSHRSGLAGNFGELGLGFKKQLSTTREEAVRHALTKPPFHTPGEVTRYSNIGYTVAGAMAEAVTGLSWEELMEQEVFGPLGMTSAGFGPAGEKEPRGHHKGKPVDPNWQTFLDGEGPPPDNPPLMGPAGTVHSTLEDWAKFIAAQGRHDKSFLSQASWDFLQTPRLDTSFTPGGWKKESDGRLWHSGSNTMFYSLVTLRVGDENREPRAAMVATNEAKERPSVELARALLA